MQRREDCTCNLVAMTAMQAMVQHQTMMFYITNNQHRSTLSDGCKAKRSRREP